MVMAASTGSGKTLAYMLPCIQNMHAQEQEGYIRKAKRPRCLVLVPTRELARQVLDSVKKIGHYSKISSTAVLGGEQYNTQKKDVSKLVLVVSSCIMHIPSYPLTDSALILKLSWIGWWT